MTEIVSTETSTTIEVARTLETFNSDLCAAPHALILLSQLGVISAFGNDISLVLPESKFEYLKSPSSFRASLAQVSNEAQDALFLAHHNMDFLQMTMATVPDKVIDILKLLTEGEPEEINDFLGDDVEGLSDLAKEAKVKVDEVVAKFGIVIATLKELNVKTVAASGASQDKKTEYEKQLKEAEAMEKKRHENLEKLNKEYEEAEKKLERDEEDLRKYLQSMDENSKMSLFDISTTLFVGGAAIAGPLAAAAAAAVAALIKLGAMPKVAKTKGAIVEQQAKANAAQEKKLQKLSEDTLAENLKLEKILSDNAKINVSQASNEKILRTLQQGIIALSSLQSQWAMLSSLFGRMSNVFEARLMKQIPNLQTYATYTVKKKKLTDLIKQRIVKSALEIIGSGTMVFIMCNSYMKLSRAHLLPLTQKFGEVIGLTKERDAERLEEILKKEMLPLSNKAQEAVKAICAEGHANYKTWLQQDTEYISQM